MPFQPSGVRSIRGMLGMTPRVLDQAVGGVSPQTVHNWEQGITYPTFETVDSIYELCD